MTYKELSNLQVGDTVKDNRTGETGKVFAMVVGKSLDESEIHAKPESISMFPDELEIVKSKSMNKIYIVSSSEGSHDDYVVRNICSFLEEDKANEFISKIGELREFQKETLRKVSEQFEPFYYSMHEKPERPVRPNFPEVLRTVGEAYQKLSEKSKAFFKEVQKEHMKNMEAFKEEEHLFYAKIDESRKAFAKASKEWIETNYPTPEHLLPLKNYLEGKAVYDELFIDEIDLIEEKF